MTIPELEKTTRILRLNIIKMIGVGQKVLVPADGTETRKITRKIYEVNGPVYMRINRHDMPDLFPEDRDVEIGGLASVIKYILRGTGIPVTAIGIEDNFGQSAHNYDELLEKFGPTAENVASSARKILI
jgi:transketolase C-terminal domain/subunit